MGDQQGGPASIYRCADCGHGQNLTAIAGAHCGGPLAADGELASYAWVEDWGVLEETIECTVHPQAWLEKYIDGQWCRWWICPWCGGDGEHCNYVNKHAGWRPVSEIAALPPLPAGAGHVLDVNPGQPVRKAHCRLCTVRASSIAGGTPCPGDKHACPAEVPAGTPDAAQAFQRDEWHCRQPGQMSADFTAWTCQAGHVTTRENHQHGWRSQCGIPGCPWDFLVPAEYAGHLAARAGVPG